MGNQQHAGHAAHETEELDQVHEMVPAREHVRVPHEIFGKRLQHHLVANVETMRRLSPPGNERYGRQHNNPCAEDRHSPEPVKEAEDFREQTDSRTQ